LKENVAVKTNKNERAIHPIGEYNERGVKATVFEDAESSRSVSNPNHFESQIELVATTHTRI
jgi:hypothetical protein